MGITILFQDKEIDRILQETQKIQRQFIHYCDISIPYNDFDVACDSIMQLLETADTTPQFVPSAWVSAIGALSLIHYV